MSIWCPNCRIPSGVVRISSCTSSHRWFGSSGVYLTATFLFREVPPEADSFKVSVIGTAKGKDTDLGSVTIPLQDVPLRAKLKRWFPLVSKGEEVLGAFRWL